jgi:hypothetical protein
LDKPPSQAYPPPPEGYQAAELFQYPTIKLQLLSIAILVLLAPALFIITLVMQRNPKGEVFLFSFKAIDIVIVIATILLTLVLHELVHGLTYRLLGYKVRYGVSLRHLAAYAGVFGQWQKRDHNIIAALAPLVILAVLVFPLLGASNGSLVLIAFTLILINTAGASGDLYLTLRLLRMPRASLGYDVDVSTMLVYKPLEP